MSQNARPDGRPLYYDIAPGDRVQCALCVDNGQHAQYGTGQGFLADPANSPFEDEGVYTVCLGHIPDNSVIFNPGSGLTRTKDGQNEWREDTVEDMPPRADA